MTRAPRDVFVIEVEYGENLGIYAKKLREDVNGKNKRETDLKKELRELGTQTLLTVQYNQILCGSAHRDLKPDNMLFVE
jgi:serine/threonine protein kinase